MALQLRQSTQFKRDVKRLTRQGADLAKIEAVVIRLVAELPLEERYRDHALAGNGVVTVIVILSRIGFLSTALLTMNCS